MEALPKDLVHFLANPSFNISEPEANDELNKDQEAYMTAILAKCMKTWLQSIEHHLGYPLNSNLEYGVLSELQHFPINNIGDPFILSNYGVNSHQFEVGVLEWFANLWDIDKGKYWGYVTSGGSEGNFHGIIMAREILPNGILYASNESHYSVFKAARMYKMDCIKIGTLVSGEIDCVDFKAKVFQNKERPAIVNVNIGTTFKGAVDNLSLVIQTLQECGFSRNEFYVHCDAALSGLILPFIKQAPKITFKNPIDSVSVSGHKILGCPMPCGVLMTRIEHICTFSRDIDCIASRDATFMGSRNGHNPIFLWYVLNKKGYLGLQKDVQKCLNNAHYLKDQLKNAGISTMMNELSNIVVFERPPDEEFIRHWQLSCHENISRIVVMPHVTKGKLDTFLDELLTKRSNWFKIGTHQPPCVASEIGNDNCVCSLHM